MMLWNIRRAIGNGVIREPRLLFRLRWGIQGSLSAGLRRLLDL